MVILQKLESYHQLEKRFGPSTRPLLPLLISIIISLVQCTPGTENSKKTNKRSTDTKILLEKPSQPTVIKKIFLKQKKSSRPESLTLSFVGDIMFGRYDEQGLNRNPEPDAPVFEKVTHLINADLSIANLETPLLKTPYSTCPWPPSLRFVGGPWAAKALKTAGFDAVTLSNNHIYDMRKQGIADTRELLEGEGIVPVGAPGENGRSPFETVTFNAAGWRIGLIGFNTLRNSLPSAGTPPLPHIPHNHEVARTLEPVIADARDQHDLIIVLAHWGVSDVDAPAKPRRKASRSLIDLGADLVISHHPHVLQGIERYKHGLIAHSLGDFLFDRVRDTARLSGVLRLHYSPGSRTPNAVKFHPIFLKKVGESIHPLPASGFMSKLILSRMADLSAPFGTRWKEKEDVLIIE